MEDIRALFGLPAKIMNTGATSASSSGAVRHTYLHLAGTTNVLVRQKD